MVFELTWGTLVLKLKVVGTSPLKDPPVIHQVLRNRIRKLRLLTMIHIEQRIPNRTCSLRYLTIQILRLRHQELLVRGALNGLAIFLPVQEPVIRRHDIRYRCHATTRKLESYTRWERRLPIRSHGINHFLRNDIRMHDPWKHNIAADIIFLLSSAPILSHPTRSSGILTILSTLLTPLTKFSTAALAPLYSG